MVHCILINDIYFEASKGMKITMAQPVDPQPLGPKKTFFVMVTVVGCIAILWPKIFHPMLFSTTMKANVIDQRGTGCCDVVLDQDEFVNTSVLMQNSSEKPSFRKHLKLLTENTSIRQERPPHLRADVIHPAMKERGRAFHPSLPTIPITTDRPHVPPIKPKFVEGRPGPIPGMRPPMGAGSHPQSTKTSSMGLIMPLYTVGIVAFFLYTIMKLVCKKSPTTPYEPIQSNPKFREKVFENVEQQLLKRPEDGTTKLAWKDHDAIVTAIQGIIDAANEHILEHNLKDKEELHQIENNEPFIKSSQDVQSVTEILYRGGPPAVVQSQNQENKDNGTAQVKVVGLELTAVCQDNKRWNRPLSPISPLLSHRYHHENSNVEAVTDDPNMIFIQASVEPDAQILVADTNQTSEELLEHNELADTAVILSGRMTLSLINTRLMSPKSNKKEFPEIDEYLDKNEDMEIEAGSMEITKN
ncbi:uncharacterized protein LOC134831590 isoform X8 [Culicoides brevitarsis]|uniref:uncharacterized protein LOC134831590 isoform X8 n=1 Tax=Culicoides brevitarsis TaxID=469753 RepID=UPI00307C1D15